ncbi:dolichyl-phosphate-mannose-protein mannosyltransferase [Mucilaginibacter frigoritolerans]|uniref:Dolichyl-phosphate-mannose-protein mannosyltransferase n=1 Tax=Mucilaginibacter frigoritolerans TaxID=652788 RepID=A0A562U7Z5_9SPHI|nr:glycosyltransferase family 39 protein [Mucilaginibacter frigoritolerans]TWJ01505.1 dolichyl-phosphate-mannose-protein mannosyltransferase [Mucilaginibacter frigoritolerans]
MINGTLNKSSQSGKIVFYFLLFWTLLNVIQASTLELQGDEAYYWLYSRYLDWGYFDHPPMVAIFIRIGDSIMHNEFGLRMLTVLASSVSIYLLWLILKKYAIDAVAFVLVISGIFIFHIYGFTTTPDAPLFFFTVLFYFFYQQYIEKDKLWLALVLAIVIAGLLYSKYNGVLVIGFTLLANWKLLKRWSFWLIVVLAVGLYVPHIIWQAQHGYPSVNYHLFERSADHYSFLNTFSYIPGQLLMAGPLIGWFLFCKAFTVRIKDAFIRCLLVNCIGTFTFFLISSARGEVQPQWTFILFAPLVMLVLIHFKQRGGRPKWLMPLAIVNLSIIIIVRVIIIAGFGFAKTYGHLKSYYGFKEWANVVKQKAGDSYVIMMEGFQNPSKYDYYTNSLKCFAYDTRYYRLTQFDIWPMEDSLQHKRAYYLTYYPIKGLSTDTIKLPAGTWYGAWVNDVRTYQKVKIETSLYKINASTKQKIVFDLKIINPYAYSINFANDPSQHQVVMESCLFKGDTLVDVQRASDSFNSIKLQPGDSTHYSFTLTSPLKKGVFDLIFSIRTDPFLGSKNSRIIKLTVN